jgi:hypothetical protein
MIKDTEVMRNEPSVPLDVKEILKHVRNLLSTIQLKTFSLIATTYALFVGRAKACALKEHAIVKQRGVV